MPQKKNLHIAIIEDEPNVREPVTQFVSQQQDMEMIGAFPSIESFLRPESAFTAPDILLLDISLNHGMSGLKGLPLIKKTYPNIDVIMLTTANDAETIFEALQSGAVAYLNKKNDLKTITQTIRIVDQGGSYMSPAIARKVANFFPKSKAPARHEQLTDRQMDIVNGLIEGLSYKMIADKLNISVQTVNDHIRRIYRTLQVNSKIEVVNIFMKNQRK